MTCSSLPILWTLKRYSWVSNKVIDPVIGSYLLNSNAIKFDTDWKKNLNFSWLLPVDVKFTRREIVQFSVTCFAWRFQRGDSSAVCTNSRSLGFARFILLCWAASLRYAEHLFNVSWIYWVLVHLSRNSCHSGLFCFLLGISWHIKTLQKRKIKISAGHTR